ncbi:MAG: ribonuclease HII [Kiritimatiellia bacterium]|jgi:ribonuclease HII
MRILGIDEAGRGCVFGDLVVAGFIWDHEDQTPLTEAGATDSKKLSAKRRVSARAKLELLGQWDVRCITPAQIDAGNLNTLEELVIADLVRTWKPDLVIVDALGHPSGLGKVLARLQAQVAPLNPTWCIEPKADLNHPACGAASIFAKTDRDAALHELIEDWGVLGSGYPSDPKTKAWLAEWNTTRKPWPSFVRTRWGTVRALAQQGLA